MSTSYASLQLGDVMMHQIIRAPAGTGGFSVVLTDEPVSISAENLEFLTLRFMKALTGKALPIVEDGGFSTQAPSRVRSGDC